MLNAISDFISKVTRGEKLRIGDSEAEWKKVSELTPGMKIAVPEDETMDKWLNGQIAKKEAVKTPRGWQAERSEAMTPPTVEESGNGYGDVLWDEIVSIRRLSPECVYDIEVEGTRNFVAGHLLEFSLPKTPRILTDEPLRGPPSNKWFGGFFAHNTYISGYDLLVSSESASLNADNGNIYELRTKSGNIIYDLASYSQAVIANIKAGLVEAAQGIFDTIVANSAVIKNLSVENLTVGNLTQLGDNQILSPVGDLTATGTANLARLKTDSIAPLSDQGKIEFDGTISVKGNDGMEVVSIDSSGSASFAGTLKSDQAQFNEATVAGIITSKETQTGKLSAGEATISGELSVNNLKVAGTIESEQMTGLQSSFGDLLGRVTTLENAAPTPTDMPSPTLSSLDTATLSAESSTSSATLLDQLTGFLTSSSQLNKNVEQFIATSTAFINPTAIPNPDNNVALTDNIVLSQPTDTSSQNQILTLSDLTVYGQSSLADTTISGQLIVDGGIVIENNKVASLGNTLYLSSLNSIDILGGQLVIDKFGNLDVAGQIIAREGIVTDQITPLGKDLTINLSKENTTDPDSFGNLIIKGTSDEPAASFDASGNATISGELTLNKLNLNYKEASPSSVSGLLSAAETFSLYGINAPSAVSLGTTGQNIIPAGSQQLVIYNNQITEHTLIYITPASPTANKVIFVADKKAGSYFTVALDTPIPYDVKFNWWIIN